MKSNILFCFIIGILIGFVAKAGEKTPASGHADNFLVAVQVSHDQAKGFIEAHETFKSKLPEPKARKIRPRFRGVSFFTLQQISSETQSYNSLHDIKVLLSTGNQAPALPFYYIFLFRLTPF